MLFTGHYFPDDSYDSQIVNIGSLILGHNGIWGDLPAVSEKGVQLFANLMGLHKQVSEDITESWPVRSGLVAGSPEIYEKISERTGRGVVVVFATEPGEYSYVTRNRVVAEHWSTDGVSFRRDERQRASLRMNFVASGAKIIFFGVKPDRVPTTD